MCTGGVVDIPPVQLVQKRPEGRTSPPLLVKCLSKKGTPSGPGPLLSVCLEGWGGSLALPQAEVGAGD